MWHNHLGTIHYPNFGADFDNIALVSGVIARPPIANMSARVFTCDPQNTEFAGPYDRWASGMGTRFVRSVDVGNNVNTSATIERSHNNPATGVLGRCRCRR